MPFACFKRELQQLSVGTSKANRQHNVRDVLETSIDVSFTSICWSKFRLFALPVDFKGYLKELLLLLLKLEQENLGKKAVSLFKILMKQLNCDNE